MGKPLGSVTGPVIQVSGRRNLYRRSYTRYGSLGTPRSQRHTSRNVASCEATFMPLCLMDSNDEISTRWEGVHSESKASTVSEENLRRSIGNVTGEERSAFGEVRHEAEKVAPILGLQRTRKNTDRPSTKY